MIHDSKHPIWPIIRIAVVMGALVVILMLTAQHFDETEIETLVYAFATIAGIEGVVNVVNRMSGKE